MSERYRPGARVVNLHYMAKRLLPTHRLGTVLGNADYIDSNKAGPRDYWVRWDYDPGTTPRIEDPHKGGYAWAYNEDYLALDEYYIREIPV